MSAISNQHYIRTMGIKSLLEENADIDRRILLEIIEEQLIYEGFIDTVSKFAGDVKDKVVTAINDFKDFASVIYRVIKQGIGDTFSTVLLRNFNSSDIKKKIQEILDKIGKSDVLKNLLSGINSISNPILKLLSTVGVTVAAKYFYDKFKDLDLSADNIKKQVTDYITGFLSDQALETIKGFVSGGFSTLVDWFKKIGVAAANVYKTLQSTIEKFKEAFSKEDKGNKFATMLVKEELHEGEYCPQCLAEYIIAHKNIITEAEYKGRNVPLGKPMKGDVKKFKVYVKNKKGNVIKVEFGQPGVKIKKNNPARRKSFRARHKCHTAKDRTTARYWSCRKW